MSWQGRISSGNDQSVVNGLPWPAVPYLHDFEPV
ncbi:hypothetical protein COLO4_24922 [Corchorus olitorius]|uniref:Uncharacterized protein n=1 Tax=Corchorus olitorius TaxID=93759 RepID=A0A1R3I5S6_9ROSI|nr:hypothetical protein COLO4_24922 [Corchorus olitorius]